MQRLSGSPIKALPIIPPLQGTLGSTSRSTSRPETQEQRQSSDSSSNGITFMSSSTSKRLSTQPVPRPAPIPIPEPVAVLPSSGENSNEGPSSSDSTNSALGSVNAELIQHITIGGAHHSHSSSLSPSSPRETNNLLGDTNGVPLPRSNYSPRIVSMPTGSQRPHSAVDTSSSPYSTAGAGTIDMNNSHISGNNRPYSSADQWGARPTSVHDLSGEQQQHNVGSSSRSHSPSADSMLRPAGAMPRSRSSNFINTPSPLNPNSLPIPRRPGSSSSRPGSMVLYRLAGIGDDFNPQMASLSPPVTTNSRRASRFSTMSSSTSIFSDSKYPAPAREEGSLTPPPSGAFLPYEYDPSWDQDAPDDAEDELHAPDPPGKKERMGEFNLRGFFNICVMMTILGGLISIFVLYPVVSYYTPNAKSGFLSGTDQTDNPANQGGATNSTSTTRTRNDLIDTDTPDSAKSWAGLDGNTYKLVFSDEFNTDGRTFKPTDDPFWEAVDLHDAKNDDLNWYDSGHVTTKSGSLVITMEQAASNGFAYTSGMLQSWNKLCFQGGYIEVSVSLPGTNQNIGFTPQAYTMGNLARSGYGATEDGVFPYSYDTCDNAVLLDQGLGDGSSTLPAQRLSACTCAAEQTTGGHPGGTADGGNPSLGRGSPAIDILGYLNDQTSASTSDVVSQSIKVAPFSRNRQVTGATIRSTADTITNPYTGDATQQVISALTSVPAAGYVQSGAQFTAFGYEHLLNGGTATQGSLHWTKASTTETFRVMASALAADENTSQRLITNEPMYIVLSLALSNLASQVDPTTLTFPAQFLVDYVRVYQIDGQTKTDCSPTDYPTSNYINTHQTAYGDATRKTWASTGYGVPTNSQAGNC